MVPTNTPRTRTCPVCSSSVREDFLYTHVRTDLDILNGLMHQNPSWVLPDGSCPRGLQELRSSRASDLEVAAREA